MIYSVFDSNPSAWLTDSYLVTRTFDSSAMIIVGGFCKIHLFYCINWSTKTGGNEHFHLL